MELKKSVDLTPQDLALLLPNPSPALRAAAADYAPHVLSIQDHFDQLFLSYALLINHRMAA